MTPDRWQDLKGELKKKFSVIEEGKNELGEIPGTVEHVIFDGPMGKMKIEFTERPLVLDKKTIGSKRMGSQASVSFVYSEDEKTHHFAAYRWDEIISDWTEIKGELIDNN